MKQVLAAVAFWAALGGMALAQHNRIDSLRPDAPELAARGEHAVGVRTIELVSKDRLDVLAGTGATYDRPLTVELWYPAAGTDPQAETRYEDVILVDGTTKVALTGTATRDAVRYAYVERTDSARDYISFDDETLRDTGWNVTSQGRDSGRTSSYQRSLIGRQACKAGYVAIR